MYTSFHIVTDLVMVKDNGLFHLVFLSNLIILNSNAYVFHHKYDFYIFCVSSTMMNFIENTSFQGTTFPCLIGVTCP